MKNWNPKFLYENLSIFLWFPKEIMQKFQPSAELQLFEKQVHAAPSTFCFHVKWGIIHDSIEVFIEKKTNLTT